MKQLFCICLLLLLAPFIGCKPENKLISTETVKNVSGAWEIVRATENGANLMPYFNFSNFRITFTDSTYAIDSLVPFIVSRNGKWAFNDPQYPFSIMFTPTDSATVSSPLQFPVVGGVRNLIITFSPGCPQNSYQYTLQPAQ
jgi:hypothetical protein